MIIHIYANGQHQKRNDCADLNAKNADIIIAADGGAKQCKRLSIIPHLLVGDFDSVSPALLKDYGQAGVEIIRHPARKNATDLELALDLAKDKGAKKIIIFGALGGRWDMSLANVMLAASDKYRDIQMTLSYTDCRMHIVHGGSTLNLNDRKGQLMSLIPLSATAEGVNLTGFEYGLKDATLTFGSSRGISNIVRSEQATVTLTGGILICVEELTTQLNPNN